MRNIYIENMVDISTSMKFNIYSRLPYFSRDK